MGSLGDGLDSFGDMVYPVWWKLASTLLTRNTLSILSICKLLSCSSQDCPLLVHATDILCMVPLAFLPPSIIVSVGPPLTFILGVKF